tara:strand:- start:309 stop:521 length:213 start_codon:yes stop_codon:yes gene_type:complete
MYSKPVLLNMPSDMLEAFDTFSSQEKTPRSKLIKEACKQFIQHRLSGDYKPTKITNEEPVRFYSSSGTGF